jgi:hypothetical protein
MNRQSFRDFRSKCRKAKRSANIQHNGHTYAISQDGCDRLDSSGCYDRLPGANIAMAINHAADARRRLKLPRACAGLISLAREWRLSA